MNSFKILILSAFALALSSLTAHAQEDNPVAVQDGDTVITEQELTYLVGTWTSQMRSVAVVDEGDRLELLNLMMANKRIAAEADALVAEKPELFYEYQHAMEGFKRDFILRYYRDNLDMPDFGELAKEQYTVKRDKYALVPETRMSSHILFMARPGEPREEILVKAAEVLAELRNGADFGEMVAQYSGEPGAAEDEGKFPRWVKYGDPAVSPPYSEGLFEIESVGEYSELVQTQFGVHIIRLDGIQEKSYKPFEEVGAAIITDLHNEYVKLAMKDFVTRFNFSDDVVIDDEVVSRILAPYQPQ